MDWSRASHRAGEREPPTPAGDVATTQTFPPSGRAGGRLCVGTRAERLADPVRVRPARRARFARCAYGGSPAPRRQSLGEGVRTRGENWPVERASENGRSVNRGVSPICAPARLYGGCRVQIVHIVQPAIRTRGCDRTEEADCSCALSGARFDAIPVHHHRVRDVQILRPGGRRPSDH